MGYIIKDPTGSGKTYHYDSKHNLKGVSDSKGNYNKHNSGGSKDKNTSSSGGGSRDKNTSSSGGSRDKNTSSSGGGSRNKNKNNSNPWKNVSNTSGYAEYYRQARADGANDADAHKYATYKNGGSGITAKEYDTIASNNPNYNPKKDRPSTNRNGYVVNKDYDTGFYESDYLKQQEELDAWKQKYDEMMSQSSQWQNRYEDMMNDYNSQRNQWQKKYQNMQKDYSSQVKDLESTLKEALNKRDPKQIYDEIMAMMPKREEVPVISYDEATSRARDQLEGLYDQKGKEVMKNLDKNNLRRGFYGQLPADAIKNYKQQELETQKNSAVTNLANDLVGQSKLDADRISQRSMQEQQSQLNTLLSALSQSGALEQNNLNNTLQMLGYLSGKESDYYNRERQDRVDDANYTGMWRGRSGSSGMPTLAMQQFLANQDEREYQHGRDSIMDERYYDQTSWNRDWMTQERDYKYYRDNIADKRYEDEMNWNRDWMQKEADAKYGGYWNGNPTLAMRNHWKKGSSGSGGSGGSKKEESIPMSLSDLTPKEYSALREDSIDTLLKLYGKDRFEMMSPEEKDELIKKEMQSYFKGPNTRLPVEPNGNNGVRNSLYNIYSGGGR